jgi:hypothetical protein
MIEKALRVVVVGLGLVHFMHPAVLCQDATDSSYPGTCSISTQEGVQQVLSSIRSCNCAQGGHSFSRPPKPKLQIHSEPYLLQRELFRVISFSVFIACPFRRFDFSSYGRIDLHKTFS